MVSQWGQGAPTGQIQSQEVFGQCECSKGLLSVSLECERVVMGPVLPRKGAEMAEVGCRYLSIRCFGTAACTAPRKRKESVPCLVSGLMHADFS